jgi:hypothetical protein
MVNAVLPERLLMLGCLFQVNRGEELPVTTPPSGEEAQLVKDDDVGDDDVGDDERSTLTSVYTIEVSIPSATTSTWGRNRFVSFKIIVQTDDDLWTVRRQYSDFAALHEQVEWVANVATKIFRSPDRCPWYRVVLSFQMKYKPTARSRTTRPTRRSLCRGGTARGRSRRSSRRTSAKWSTTRAWSRSDASDCATYWIWCVNAECWQLFADANSCLPCHQHRSTCKTCIQGRIAQRRAHRWLDALRRPPQLEYAADRA